MGRGSKPAELIGTQSADRIRASGHARRVEQAGHMSAPDRADLSERNPLRGGGRPHMTPLNRVETGCTSQLRASARWRVPITITRRSLQGEPTSSRDKSAVNRG